MNRIRTCIAELSGRGRRLRTTTVGRRPKVLACCALATAVLGAPATASAESGWDSSLSDVRSGFTSRTWTDRNSDGVATTTTLSGCRRIDGARFFLEVELIKDNPWPQWDASFGRRNISNCAVAPTSANWGNPGAGVFYLRFWHYDFGLVSASTVRTRY